MEGGFADTMAGSLPSRGAWIEIGGEPVIVSGREASLPSRGAWIEILTSRGVAAIRDCRSPHGERGLKLPLVVKVLPLAPGRSPHGERGLKLGAVSSLVGQLTSLPSRGAWIEIELASKNLVHAMVAPLTGSVD